MLDPHRNVDYAARFLVTLHARHETWSMAVARYHAGPDNDPAQKRYVCRVIANMVATGFGKWTGNARTFLQPMSVYPPIAQRSAARRTPITPETNSGLTGIATCQRFRTPKKLATRNDGCSGLTTRGYPFVIRQKVLIRRAGR